MTTYFITGTDTEVGKTWATVALMQAFKQQGKSVIGMKPVAAGCNEQQQNEDALLLQQHASVAVDYALINPYAYQEAVSPHIAGVDNPVVLNKVEDALRLLQAQADTVFVEGAGGWYAPINDQQAISDMAVYLNLPVILVVAIRLGCINHARLTDEAIRASGLKCVGWIANCTDDAMLRRAENIATLEKLLHTPLLGVLPYQEQADLSALAEKLHHADF